MFSIIANDIYLYDHRVTNDVPTSLLLPRFEAYLILYDLVSITYTQNQSTSSSLDEYERFFDAHNTFEQQRSSSSLKLPIGEEHEAPSPYERESSEVDFAGKLCLAVDKMRYHSELSYSLAGSFGWEIGEPD